MKNSLIMLLLPVVALQYCGCITNRGPSLESAVSSLYAAEQAGDWKAKWKLLDPDMKAEMTEDQFIQEQETKTNEFRILSWKIIRQEPMAVSKEDRKRGVQSAMKVPMDVYRQWRSRDRLIVELYLQKASKC
jgi:hypothetical protein